MNTPKDAEKALELEEFITDIANSLDEDIAALGYTKDIHRNEVRALVIYKSLKGGLKRFFKQKNSTLVDLLGVDRDLFEKDIQSSLLFESSAIRLIYPITYIVGEQYLRKGSFDYLIRKFLESIDNLILEHDEFAKEIFIQPQFFVYDILSRTSQIMPYDQYAIHHMDKGQLEIFPLYRKVLSHLVDEEILETVDGYFQISEDYVPEGDKLRFDFLSKLQQTQETLIDLLKLDARGFFDFIFSLSDRMESVQNGLPHIYNPGKYLYFKTEIGRVPLSWSLNIEDAVQRLYRDFEISDINISRLGSPINEVFLVEYNVRKKRERVILKRYLTWSNIKWAPLAFWTWGTQNFAVLNTTRMRREITSIRLLEGKGIKVPKIIYANFEEKFMIREYIKGDNIVADVKKQVRYGDKNQSKIIRRVGELLAKIHSSGLTMGDSKPENFVKEDDESLTIIDLEQGAISSNPTWDIAEFLYFSGHYVRPLDSLQGIRQLTKDLIHGYLEGGGEEDKIEEVSGLKYSKVFALITMPQVLYQISDICRNIKKHKVLI
jgi:tRNA A-37 threonylcarbamoyl transferase component Bud32